MTPRRFARLTSILDRRQTTLTVLLDDLQKAHNVSAVMRTCDAVGVGWIHALSDQDSFRAKTTSAAGSEHYVETRLHSDADAAVEALRAGGFALYAAHLDDRAVDFRDVDYTRPTCLVMGQEGPGVSTRLLELVDGTVAVPMVGAVASLNVSVATAVILYEAQRQRQLAGLYDRPHVDEHTRQRRLFEWGYRDIARWCRERGYAYPRLDDAGQIVGELPRG
ncbi:MAG: tRNA (guanosine(18)-2'-O)-methyltransferase TrmH [Acidobacteriota bacterium]